MLMTACVLISTLDEFDTTPPVGDGGLTSSSSGSLIGYRIDGPSTVTVRPNVPANIELVVVRDSTFRDLVMLDPIESTSPRTAATLINEEPDRFIVRVVASESGTLSFHARSGSRVQSVQVNVVVQPGPGELDPSFGDGGIVAFENAVIFGSYVDVQGRITLGTMVATGDGAVIRLFRFLPSGAPDPLFGHTGKGQFDLRVIDPGKEVATNIAPSGDNILISFGNKIEKVSTVNIHEPFGDGGILEFENSSVVVHGSDSLALAVERRPDEITISRLNDDGSFAKVFGDNGAFRLADLATSPQRVDCVYVDEAQQVGYFGIYQYPDGFKFYGFPANGSASTVLELGDRFGLSNTHTGCAISPSRIGVLATYELLEVLKESGTTQSPSTVLEPGPVSIAMDSADRFIMAGTLRSASSDGSALGTVGVVRHLADGTLDSSFHAKDRDFGAALLMTGPAMVKIVPSTNAVLVFGQGPGNSNVIARVLP